MAHPQTHTYRDFGTAAVLQPDLIERLAARYFDPAEELAGVEELADPTQQLGPQPQILPRGRRAEVGSGHIFGHHEPFTGY